MAPYIIKNSQIVGDAYLYHLACQFRIVIDKVLTKSLGSMLSHMLTVYLYTWYLWLFWCNILRSPALNLPLIWLLILKIYIPIICDYFNALYSNLCLCRYDNFNTLSVIAFMFVNRANNNIIPGFQKRGALWNAIFR